MDEYKKSVDFRGDPAKALEVARTAFTDIGIEVSMVSSNRMQAENKKFVLDTKRSPLLAISRAVIGVSGSSLSVEAEFGKADEASKYLMMLIGVMAVPELIILVVVFLLVVRNPMLLPICLVSIVPIPLVPPLVRKFQKSQAAKALDELMENVVNAAG